MGAALAAARPAHEPGTANGCHALTYGWLVGELNGGCRGDPSGPSCAKTSSSGSGSTGASWACPASALGRVGRPRGWPKLERSRPWLAPLNRAVTRLPFDIDRERALLDTTVTPGVDALLPSDGFLRAGVPGANGVFTARSLARIHGALTLDVSIDGVRLLSEKTRDRAIDGQNHRRDLVVLLAPHGRLGYRGVRPVRTVSSRAFGHCGMHGSGAMADPERELSVALVGLPFKGRPIVVLPAAALACADRRS